MIKWRREPGEQLTATQLFTLIFFWCAVSVGVAAAVGAAVAYGAGRDDWGIAVLVAGGAVIGSFGLTALIVRLGSMGGVATGIAYGLKLIVTACAVVWPGRALGADGTGLVVTLIVGEIVALCTMVAVVLKVEGPGFDIDES